MTKAEAIDIATLPDIGTANYPVFEHEREIGSGNPTPVYTELWYKMLMPSVHTVFTVTVWNMGGSMYWIPLDDEMMPPPPVKPGYNYRSIVIVYDSNDVAMTSGAHVEFTNIDRKNTWVYFRVLQPTTYPEPIVCWNKIRVTTRSKGEPILQGALCVQDEAIGGVIYCHPAGYAGYNGPRNYVFPENTHSVGGGAGDILFSGVSCIADVVQECVAVRDKNYRNPFIVASVESEIHNIRRNADGYSNFWVSHSHFGENRVRPINIIHDLNFNLMSVEVGPILGITAVVDRLCARGTEILYYVERGSYTVKKWDIARNIALPDLAGNPNLGVITDIMVIPDGNVLVGYNTATLPTTYTIRRYDALNGTVIRDYVFNSNGIYNRINYAEDIAHFIMWTHEISGESTFRKVRLDTGSVVWTSHYREFDIGKLVLDQELYLADGTQGYPAQWTGFANKFNFWTSPVFAVPTGVTSNNGGPLEVPPTPPLDDEFYPPILTFPPILPPIEDEMFPPYPGYPWFPPPPDSNPVPPAILPMPLRIGGGLVLLDPSNKTRHDVYLDQQGNPMPVPIVMTIRTAFLGD